MLSSTPVSLLDIIRGRLTSIDGGITFTRSAARILNLVGVAPYVSLLYLMDLAPDGEVPETERAGTQN